MARMDTKSNRESAAKISIILDLLRDELTINKRINKLSNKQVLRKDDFENLTALLTLKDIVKEWRRNVGD